tara:strand:- start:1605 stop:2054 length:450 start_codon:yes stop_codon:yes gene_type:complete
MKRRDFLETSTKLFCACAAGASLSLIQSCTNNVATSPSVEQDSEELIIDLSSEGFTTLLNEGGSITTDGNVIDSQGLLLLRQGDFIKAFRNNCTHSGYDLRPFSNGVSVCTSGHGGRFNTNGTAIASPASGTLKEYITDLEENILTIYS